MSALPKPRKKMQPGNAAGLFRPAIDEILTTDLTAPRKQRHTAKWIYERLLDERRSLESGRCLPARQAVHPRERAGVGQPPDARPGAYQSTALMLKLWLAP